MEDNTAEELVLESIIRETKKLVDVELQWMYDKSKHKYILYYYSQSGEIIPVGLFTKRVLADNYYAGILIERIPVQIKMWLEDL